MKMRSDCLLQNLTPLQLDEIFELLSTGSSFREVRLHCAKPPPEGFGLTIHHTTLVRFYQAERRRRHAEQLAQSKFDELASANPDEIIQNIKIELAHACYELAHHPGAPATVNALSRITHRLDRIKLDQERVAVEQQHLALERDALAEKKRQFNFNAAREAAHHAAKIHKVIETKGPDNEEKIWMVNDIVFGPSPASSHNPPS